MKYRYKGTCPNTQAMLQSCFPGQTVFEGQQSGNKVRVRLPRVGTIDLKLDEVETIEEVEEVKPPGETPFFELFKEAVTSHWPKEENISFSDFSEVDSLDRTNYPGLFCSEIGTRRHTIHNDEGDPTHTLDVPIEVLLFDPESRMFFFDGDLEIYGEGTSIEEADLSRKILAKSGRDNILINDPEWEDRNIEWKGRYLGEYYEWRDDDWNDSSFSFDHPVVKRYEKLKSSNPHIIYAIQSGNSVKIGKTATTDRCFRTESIEDSDGYLRYYLTANPVECMKTVAKRMEGIKTASSELPKILGLGIAIPNVFCPSYEIWFRETFSQFRKQGEWFEYQETVRDQISNDLTEPEAFRILLKFWAVKAD